MIKKGSILTLSILFLFSLNVSAQLRSFVGNWSNTDSNTSGITRIRITASGSNVYTHAWGQCSPRDCDMGRSTATRYYSSNSLSRLTASFNRTRGISRFVIFSLLRSNVLQARVFVRYSGSSRRNAVRTYRFRKTARAVLGVPVLLSPRSGARLNRNPRRTTLDWRPVSGAAAYGVEVQHYSRGLRRWSTNYIKRRVNVSNYTFNFVGDRPGRWRVWAIGRNNRAGRKSAWRTFTYTTGGVETGTLRAPVLISPRSNSTFSHFPRRTTLRWRPVAGASKYRVEVQFYSSGRYTAWKSATVSSTNYRFTFVGAQPGRWRVRAIRANNSFGRVSAWRRFKYTR